MNSAPNAMESLWKLGSSRDQKSSLLLDPACQRALEFPPGYDVPRREMIVIRPFCLLLLF